MDRAPRGSSISNAQNPNQWSHKIQQKIIVYLSSSPHQEYILAWPTITPVNIEMYGNAVLPPTQKAVNRDLDMWKDDLSSVLGNSE